MTPAAREWIPRFLSHLSTERRMLTHTDSNYRRDLELFAAYCEKQRIADWPQVDSQHVRTFASAEFRRGQSPRSIQRRLSAVRSFCNFLIREQVLKSIQRLKCKRQRRRSDCPRRSM